MVKAFNTIFAGALAAAADGSSSATVLIAGDDPEAKTLVASLVKSAGLQAIDAGSLRRARELEALGLLMLGLAVREEISWTGGIKILS
ncbi:oxidoreductase [Gordonia terrae]